MKHQRPDGKHTSAYSRPYSTITSLFVVLSLCLSRVTAGVLDPEEFRQAVADMKTDIKAGRATSVSSVSSSTGGKFNPRQSDVGFRLYTKCCCKEGSQRANTCTLTAKVIRCRDLQQYRAKIHRHCLKIYPKMCHKIILREKL